MRSSIPARSGICPYLQSCVCTCLCVCTLSDACSSIVYSGATILQCYGIKKPVCYIRDNEVIIVIESMLCYGSTNNTIIINM